jgi:hypothetical protein
VQHIAHQRPARHQFGRKIELRHHHGIGGEHPVIGADHQDSVADIRQDGFQDLGLFGILRLHLPRLGIAAQVQRQQDNDQQRHGPALGRNRQFDAAPDRRERE